VLEILDAGIHVMTAVNIQHLETLNDAVAKVTGVRVRETVPDTLLDRADEVINVDVTVEELRGRLRAGKVYKPEKVEQALTNFFRKGNLSTLRELALRAVADEVGEKAASYREREALNPRRLRARLHERAPWRPRHPHGRGSSADSAPAVCGVCRDTASPADQERFGGARINIRLAEAPLLAGAV
jgi:hypothetical protein